jgi:hypothetical protein
MDLTDISPTGVIESKSQTSQSGQLKNSLDPATGIVNPASTVAVASPSGSVAPAPIQFPNDYARQGQLDTIHNDLTSGFTAPAGVDPVKPMQDRIDALTTPPAVPQIDWIPSLLPGSASNCYAMPIDGAVHGGLLNGVGGMASFDICDKLDLVRQILGYLFMVGTVVHIFRLFTRSNGSSGA